MTEHVMMFSTSGRTDIAARLRALGESVTTTLVCRPDDTAALPGAAGFEQILAVPPDLELAAVVDLCRSLHRARPVTRIATMFERDQDRAAAVGVALGIETHDPETVRLVHDKAAMRERLRESGVEDTASRIVTTPGQAQRFGAEHGYPYIVKPLTSTASLGVRLVRDSSDTAAFTAAADVAADGGVIVEAFHAGPQFSVEAFSEVGEHEIVAITRKYSRAADLVELGHVVPADLDEPSRTAVAEHVSRALTALGVTFGPTHTEIVLTANGPRIIETHLRVGGDSITDLVRDAVGVDLIESQLRQVLGDKVLPGIRATLAEPGPARHEAIWFAAPAIAGRLVGSSNPEAPRPGVEVTMLVEPGADLDRLAGSYARLAQARARAAGADEAVAAARGAVQALTFDMRSTPVEAEIL
jgi:biotin carboxylase